jgi:hypothetical protein
MGGFQSGPDNIKLSIEKRKFLLEASAIDLVFLSDDSVTSNGETVGARNQQMLHERLQSWIDNLKEKNT